MTLAVMLVICASLASPVPRRCVEPTPTQDSPAQPPGSRPETPPPQEANPSQVAPSQQGINPQAQPAPCPPTENTCEVAPQSQPLSPPGTIPSDQQPPGVATVPEQKSTAAPTEASAKKNSKKKKRKKKTIASFGPHRTIVRDGGTSKPTGQLAPGMPSGQVTHSRHTIEQLLASTEANLERASARKLNANQQTTVDEIKIFMEQANAALKAGDLPRGQNLAIKAHLLSDDLVKH